MISISKDKAAIYFTADRNLYGNLAGRICTRSLSGTAPTLPCSACPLGGNSAAIAVRDACKRLCLTSSGGVPTSDTFHLVKE